MLLRVLDYIDCASKIQAGVLLLDIVSTSEESLPIFIANMKKSTFQPNFLNIAV
jgi:hypothetical protein